ncbi:hypothetical protein BH10PSE15_BH10PSE15_16650 [soil metagenome]
MGEVYEGSNVHTDERLAIKVILPHLADDPSVQDMFRNEARTLQKLSHPALVRYVLLSKEMQFGVYYIVTEYIGGSNLSDVLATLDPSPDDLVALLRRLAQGLGVAHSLGAVHRDIAPDNIILQDGKIREARIIDFGIAKDLTPGSHTIIGDGFGGKLGFVAPEQLGDFDRQVGPWSDVYSLGLVMLSLAQGQKVAMGSTFVDAMNLRRKGVDTSAAPPVLRGVLDKMLVADSTQRLRSMDEVIAALDAAVAGKPAVVVAPPKPAKQPAVAREKTAAIGGDGAKPNRMPLILGGSAAGVALLGAVGYLAFAGGSAPVPVTSHTTAAGVAGGTAGGAPVVDTVRAAVTRALPDIPCAWLDLNSVKAGPDGMSLALSGVAGKTPDALAAISKVVTGAGGRVSSTDFGDVVPIPAPECATIDAVRLIRAPAGAAHMTSAQRVYEYKMLDDGPYAGQMGAKAVIDLQLQSVGDFALYGVEPSGAISQILSSRSNLDEYLKAKSPLVSDLGGQHYRIQLPSNHSGWSGLVLLTGDGGFPASVLEGKVDSRPADWTRRFAAAAEKNHWQSEMVWYNIVKSS